jgi:hypothetical protein
MAVEQRIDPSLHLEIREPSTFCKSVWIWWLGPKSWPLRHWSQRGGILQYVYFEEGKRKGTSPADY